MPRRPVGLAYAALTSALLIWFWDTWQCRDCELVAGLAGWVWSGAVLGVSQIAFVVIAAWMNNKVVLILASILLLGICAFIYLLTHMVS